MKKDFDNWNIKKKYLDKSSKDLIFNEGEIWWSHFGVNVGEEAYGKGEYFRRPVIILKKISQGSCIVIPTTTKIKEGENFFKFTTDNLERRAMLYQIKFMSSKRLYVRESTMEKEDFIELKKIPSELARNLFMVTERSERSMFGSVGFPWYVYILSNPKSLSNHPIFSKLKLC